MWDEHNFATKSRRSRKGIWCIQFVCFHLGVIRFHMWFIDHVFCIFKTNWKVIQKKVCGKNSSNCGGKLIIIHNNTCNESLKSICALPPYQIAHPLPHLLFYPLVQQWWFFFIIINNKTWHFHLGILSCKFFFKRVNHSTKSSHVWSKWWGHWVNVHQTPSTWINENWHSLVSKVASIEIAPFSPNENIDYICDGVWMPIVDGMWIPLTFPTSWKIKHITWMMQNPCVDRNGKVFV